jgi:hypothetical protein
MATYVFSYRNPNGYAPSPETRAQWSDWFEGMGDALVSIGQPVSNRSSLGNCASDTTGLGGYSMVSAPDLEAALAIAKGSLLVGPTAGRAARELSAEAPAAARWLEQPGRGDRLPPWVPSPSTHAGQRTSQ